MGQIMKNVKDLEKGLTKNAYNMSGVLKTTAATMGGLVMTDLAMRGVNKMFSASKTPRKKYFNNMISQTPELKNEDEKKVKKLFGVVSQYAPDLAKNPTVAGSIVKRFVDYGDVDPMTLREIISTQSTISTTGVNPMLPAYGTAITNTGKEVVKSQV